MKLLSLICLSLLLLACQNRAAKSSDGTISIDKSSKTNIRISDEETVGVDLLKSKAEGSSDNIQVDTRVVAIKFFPALYNSFLYVAVLKRLKNKGVQAHVVESSGFAAVILALYANSNNTSEFEWKVFKLYKKIDGLKPFSGEWERQLENFVQKEFRDKKLFQMRRLLLLTSIEDNSIVYNLDQKVSDALMISVSSRQRSSFYVNPLYDAKALEKSSSCDACLQISANSRLVQLRTNQNPSFRFFTKISGLVQKHKDEIFIMDDLNTKLDETSGLEVMFSKYSDNIDKIVDEIVESINEG